MRKIRLSDTDLELFDIEIGPTDYLFYQRHKDAFKTMYREQGRPFWTRFQISFRSFTVKHGIIKQMNIDSPKFQNLLDQAFIFIHEHFVDAKESTAKNFIDDVARLAQNQDRFPGLDSKSFAKDPFFTRDTRELFRKFFGPPDQKSSYLKVYILCPVYLRFGGSVCRCLIRWMEAPNMDNPNDDSYWIPPAPSVIEKSREETIEVAMCNFCSDDCGTKFFREKILGESSGPISLDFWTLGDPRFNDPDNPLFAPHLNPNDDWRNVLSVEMFKDFYNYTRFKYGSAEDKCKECHRLKKKRDKFIHVCKGNKKKKKQETKDKEELLKDLKEVRNRIDELEDDDIQEDYQTRIHNIIKDKPRVREALEEAERKEKLEQLHTDQIVVDKEKQKAGKKNKKKRNDDKKKDITDKSETGAKNETDPSENKDKVKDENSDKEVNEIGESDVKDTSDSDTSSKETSVEKEIGKNTDELKKEIKNIESDSKTIENDTKGNKESNNAQVETSAVEESVNGPQTDHNGAEGATDSKVGEEINSEKSEEIVDAIGNGPFNHETTKCDHGHYSFMSGKDATPSKNIVSGFKVIKIEDADNGLFEVNVSAACLKSTDEEDTHVAEMKEQLKTQELNNFIMSANLLREKIYGLPQKLEWWEGRGFAVAVVNYEEEEKEFTKKWTNFTLKINGYDENAIKQTLIQLLIYVSKRKHRICYGWNMEVDDVVACILPEESPAIEDLSISISRGFCFEDRLTEFEKQSLLKHYPTLNLDLVLCGIGKGAAVKTFEKKGGKEKLRKIIDLIAEKEILAKDLPVVDIEKLRKKLNNKKEITKGDILWEQLIRKPENFEVFVLLDKDLVNGEDEWWNLGMKQMDVRRYNNTRNPDRKICPICKIVGMDCTCEKLIEIAPKVVEFVESSDFEKVKVLGDVDGPELPKMKYTETNLGMDKSNKPEKKSKQSKSAKKKERRIEITDMPTKFLEAGLDCDKTSITIPTRKEEPLLGKVPIPVADKLERLAPVPGLQNSLNFTFQNGKKEQTITVTLGAYMPEETINEIQEKKELLKLLEEEEKRKNAKAIAPVEKKEKKKKEKAKSKSPQKSATAPEVDEDKVTRKEKTADITARFLKEIFADEDKLMKVTSTLHQHMGLSNKKLAEKKAMREEKKAQAAPPPSCACPHHEEIQKLKKEDEEKREEEERKKKLNAFAEQLMDIVDNKSTSTYKNDPEMKYIVDQVLGPKQDNVRKEKKTKVADVKQEKKPKVNRVKVDKKPPNVESMKEEKKPQVESAKEEKKSKVESVKEEKNPPKAESSDVGEKSAKSRKSRNAEVESAEVDKLPDESASHQDVKDEGKGTAKVNGEVKDISSDEREGAQSGTLRLCGNCEKVEPARKAFKKCQKCKDEGVLEVKYYCCRDCQVEDWKKKHKMEHKDGLLG